MPRDVTGPVSASARRTAEPSLGRCSGRDRTLWRDADFAVKQLVEVALRAQDQIELHHQAQLIRRAADAALPSPTTAPSSRLGSLTR